MLPIDPDDRLLRLLRGEPLTPEPTSDDERVLLRLGRAAQAAGARTDEELPAPPTQIWERVAAELGLAGVIPGPGAEPEPDTVAQPPATGGGATILPLMQRPPRPGRSWRGLVLAAASLVAVIAVGAALLTNRTGGSQVVAEVALQPLEGSGSGEARLVRSADGRTYLRLDQQLDPLPEGSYAEVWLIDPASNL